MTCWVGHRPERARVGRVGAVVAHQEELARRDHPGALVARNGRRLGRVTGGDREEVRLIDRRAIDEDPAVVDRDGVPAEPDDALDERRPVLLDPVGGRREDDDVAALVRVEARRQLVHQDVLVGLQRVLHRLLLDLVRLGDERLDDEEDDEREDECLDDLEETSEHGSSGHKTGSIGAASWGRRHLAGPCITCSPGEFDPASRALLHSPTACKVPARLGYRRDRLSRLSPVVVPEWRRARPAGSRSTAHLEEDRKT